MDYNDLAKNINKDTLAEVAKSVGIKDVDKIPVKKVKEMVQSLDKSKISKYNCIIITSKRQVKCKKVKISDEHIISPFSEFKRGAWKNDDVKIAYLKNGRENKTASTILGLPIKGDLIIFLDRDATISDYNQVISFENL